VYATHAEISPEPGAVGREGSARVSPRRTTTYRLLAEREGATAEATATLTVLPAPPPPPPAPAGPPLDELFAQNVKDIFFEFNKYEIRPEASNQLQIAARFLLEYPEIRVLIEGHCDEIGTVEYNVRLGERRTQVTRDFLVAQGVSPERIETVSVGKARPFCTESIEESCRQLNRRAHFVRIP
jgi:peptidoglycan-associated lipoprotein